MLKLKAGVSYIKVKSGMWHEAMSAAPRLQHPEESGCCGKTFQPIEVTWGKPPGAVCKKCDS